MIDASDKQWIDTASYSTLLNKWRHTSLGDPMFAGEGGEYFSKVMFQKKAELSNGEQVAASKRVGWGNDS